VVSGLGFLAGLNGSDSANSTTKAAVSEGTLTIRDKANQQQNVAELSRDVENANPGLAQIFDKEKEQNRLKAAQLIGEIGSQVADIARTEGQISGEKAKRDPMALQAAKETLAGKGNLNPTEKQIADQAYSTAMAPFGTGSSLQQGIQAATAVIQGLAGGNIGQAISGAASPYLAEQIHKLTEGNPEAKAMAHAVVRAVASYASGNSALAGAAGAVSGELMAQLVMKQLNIRRDLPLLTVRQLLTGPLQRGHHLRLRWQFRLWLLPGNNQAVLHHLHVNRRPGRKPCLFQSPVFKAKNAE